VAQRAALSSTKIKDAVEIPSTSLTEREEGREKSAEGEG